MYPSSQNLVVIFTRRTLSRDAEFEGLGLHSGVAVRVVIRAGEDGIAFRHGQDRTPARPDLVTDTRRCTRLGTISTIEHLMSAFAGLGITDAEVELTQPELPALDGSAKDWVTGLLAAGTHELGTKELRSPFARLFVREDDVSIGIAKGSGHFKYVFDTGNRWPGRQEFETQVANYVESIAPARTLVFEEEIEAARAAGLGRGLDETSVLALGRQGYLNSARFGDEPARHKLLDLIGDLYLAGVPPSQLDVSAERSGHTANVKAAAKLWAAVH